MKLGEYLQTLRKERGLTLRKVAELSKSLKVSPSGSVSLAQLVNIEKGRVAEPGISKLTTLSLIYGVRVGDLIDRLPGMGSWETVHAITEAAKAIPGVREYVDDSAVIGLMRALQAPGEDAGRRRTILNSILLLSGDELRMVLDAVLKIHCQSQSFIDFLARTPEARKWVSGKIAGSEKVGKQSARGVKVVRQDHGTVKYKPRARSEEIPSQVRTSKGHRRRSELK